MAPHSANPNEHGGFFRFVGEKMACGRLLLLPNPTQPRIQSRTSAKSYESGGPGTGGQEGFGGVFFPGRGK